MAADFLTRSARHRHAIPACRTVFVPRAIAVAAAFGCRRIVDTTVVRADFAAAAIAVRRTASRFFDASMVADFIARSAA